MDDARQQRITKARAILNNKVFLSKSEEQSRITNHLLERGLLRVDLQMIYQEQTPFNMLDNNSFASVLSQLTPREVLQNCKLGRKFATVCRDPQVFTFLLRKHYPDSFYADNPRQQYIALTTGVETIYILPSLNNNKYDKPKQLIPSSRPEDTPGWTLGNMHVSNISMIPVFAAWIAKNSKQGKTRTLSKIS